MNTLLYFVRDFVPSFGIVTEILSKADSSREATKTFLVFSFCKKGFLLQ